MASCRSVRTFLVFLALLAFAPPSLQAVCFWPGENYPIFQCAECAYFEPVPAPHAPDDVVAVFWQIGFGNNLVNSGTGSAGQGMSGPTTFNGNDSGIFPVDVVDFTNYGGLGCVPPGSVCLRNNDWVNPGVDGCPDNPRANPFEYAGALYAGDDDILNPYFGTYLDAYGGPGYYSRASIMDYPMAALMTTPDGLHFAVAAVATRSRNNDGSGLNGPCNLSSPSSNPAPCDTEEGWFDFGAVSDGNPNIYDGRSNAVPWQSAPQPDVVASTPETPGDPISALLVDIQWTGVVVHSDQSSIPSWNPTLAPADPASAPGVGVLDIAGRFGGLVRYELQIAALSDIAFTSPLQIHVCPGDPACTSETAASVTLPLDTCLRIQTLFGKRPQVTTVSTAECRLGRCGDLGFGVASRRFCYHPGCTPSPEICDNLDNDCNGVTDGFTTTCGVGQCASTGTCTTGTDDCVPGLPSPEICDNLDNDCDGVTDEFATSCGIGECSASGFCSAGVDTCVPGSPQPEICDGLDNDCDGDVDEQCLAPEVNASISPTTLNVNAQGNSFTISLQLTDLSNPGSPSPIDGSLVGRTFLSRAGSILLPDPLSIPCPGPGGDTAFERGISDNPTSRVTNLGGAALRFNLSPDGDCATLDGDRQDLLAVLSDVPDNASVPVCVSGTVDGISFESCATATVKNRGNR